MGRSIVVSALVAVAVAGCGEAPELPRACVEADPAAVRSALRAAPERATLDDGTLLSTCVDHAESDGQLQALGITFVAVAEQLAGELRGSADAAFQLGWLIGAAERGAGPTGGTQGELVQRLQQTAGFRDGAAARRAEVMRGMAAGRRDG